MKKWNIVILMMGMLWFAGGVATAGIYIDGSLYSEDVLDITHSFFNNRSIELTENSILNIYSNIDENIALNTTIEASDSSVVNLISDVPIFVMFNLIDNFWTYEDIQISYQNYPELVNPLISGTDALFSRRYGAHSYWEIDSVDLADDAVMNVFVPEPTTLLLFGIGGLLIRRKV